MKELYESIINTNTKKWENEKKFFEKRIKDLEWSAKNNIPLQKKDTGISYGASSWKKQETKEIQTKYEKAEEKIKKLNAEIKELKKKTLTDSKLEKVNKNDASFMSVNEKKELTKLRDDNTYYLEELTRVKNELEITEFNRVEFENLLKDREEEIERLRSQVQTSNKKEVTVTNKNNVDKKEFEDLREKIKTYETDSKDNKEKNRLLETRNLSLAAENKRLRGKLEDSQASSGEWEKKYNE